MTKAVIPAAGMGTRFLPASKAVPKELLPIVDTPAIEYVVAEAAAVGARDVLMITGRGKAALEEHFDRNAELERALEAKGDTPAAGAGAPLHRARRPSTTCGRATRWAWATRSSAPPITWATSRSPYCSVTT